MKPRTEPAGPRRRPADGGYACGDEKRVRIVEAALRAFGQLGYERASTRQIAQDAGVNPPALQYYFESKEGLHHACAEHVVERMSEALAPALAAADLVGPADGRGAAVAALCAVMDALAEFLFGSPLMENWSRFLARAQSEGDGSAYDYKRRWSSDRLYGSCFRLVGLALDEPADATATKLRAIMLLGQFTVIHLSRGNALAQLGWPDATGERLALVKRLLREQTMTVLAGAAMSRSKNLEEQGCL